MAKTSPARAASTAPIAAGDTVQLKTGSVAMTVSKVDGENVTVFYSEGKVVRTNTLPAACFVPYVEAN